MGTVNHVLIAKDRCAEHFVVELADVARPRILDERVRGSHRQFERRPICGPMLSQKMPSQRDDVCATLPKRWNVNGDNRHAVVEVFAKVAGCHLVDEVSIGRSDQPEIGLSFRRGSNRPKSSLLKDAEQFYLLVQGHLADLVEK